ncbi:NAD(+)/NADH kinase [Peptococcaceae bacterium 1198_IL3148]
MKTIGIVLNKQKYKVAPVVEEVCRWLENRGIRVLLNDECAESLGVTNKGLTLEQLAKFSDCIMVWGGDGTILNSTRIAAPLGTPLYGVNAGRLGFLTEVDIPDLIPDLEKLLVGDYTIEERMMIEARVNRQGQVIQTSHGLNDAVISKGALARMIWLRIYSDGELVNSYPADGVIVASPTGSTAYSLSAGGPIVGPNLDLMVISPICPHTLSARPLVISPEDVISVVPDIPHGESEIMLTLDGQYGYKLQPKDDVQIRRAPYAAKFIRTHKSNFYSVLREKLEEWSSFHE